MKTDYLKGKNVLILGYALTGKSVAEYLFKHKANITINDRGDLSNDPSVQFLLKEGVKVVDGGHPLSLLDADVDFIVKNPGIPYSLAIVVKALELGIPIYSDVELAYWFSKSPFIGITGSNGKSTTTSLIYDLLQNKSRGNAYLAGNIGVPSLSVIQDSTIEDDIIIELSSFQLEGTQDFRPQIAVITNIYEAHLDYHLTREAYVNAKLKILRNQTEDDIIIFHYDKGELDSWVQRYPSLKIPFTAEQADDYVLNNGLYVQEEWIYFKGERILALKDIKIPGKHNIENVLAAVAVAKVKGIDNHSIRASVQTYYGMKHRIQPVTQMAGREFYNDSKATNSTATITALKSFKQPIQFIGGGLDRGVDFDDLIPHLKDVKAAYLYAETKDKMRKSFEKANIESIQLFDTLEEATKSAYLNAEAGDIVLLSPASASWDQFKSFEDRGDLFIDTINRLLKTHPYDKK